MKKSQNIAISIWKAICADNHCFEEALTLRNLTKSRIPQ